MEQRAQQAQEHVASPRARTGGDERKNDKFGAHQQQQVPMQSPPGGMNMAYIQTAGYPPQGMPPQGMAPQGMQYYPVVPAPQGMQYYPVQAHQMQQLQMYTPSQQVGVGVQPLNTNMFFKTRLCNKWRSGMCPFGDKCTYAHGQHEMRQLDPQVLMQQQMYAGGMPAGMQGGMAGGMQGGMQGHHGDKGRYGRRGEGEKTQLYYKTRLCIRFMQSGYCTRGNECTFAHGYDDLRLMAKSDEPGVVKQREEARGEDGDGAGAKGPDTDEGLSAEQARARRACESDGGDGKAKEARDGVMERKANPYADNAAEVVKN